MIESFLNAVPTSEAFPVLSKPGRLSTPKSIALVVSLQILLAPLIQLSSVVAVTYAVVALAWGLRAATRGDRVAIACAAAYIAGAEVLWRMVNAPIPWQFAKYAICLVIGVGLFRTRGMAWRVLPIVYFILLIPSISVSLLDPSLENGKIVQEVSEYMASPLALALGFWFCSQLHITHTEFKRILFSFIAPCITIATVTLLSTYSGAPIAFTDESNFVTSNGFGPNQVSGALGLGALLSLLYVTGPQLRRGVEGIFILLIGLLLTQTVMTFSRGGVYAFGIGSVVGLPYLLSDRRARKRVILTLSVLGFVGSTVVFPRLEQFTGGALSSRFQDTSPGRRDALVRDDLLIWRDHAILGVGPGGSREHRETTFGPGHTEYTRLVAEHGAFGFVALLLLLGMASRPIFLGGDSWSKAARAALVAALLVSMGTAALRIAAYGLMLGLAQIRLRTSKPNARSEIRASTSSPIGQRRNELPLTAPDLKPT